MKRIIAICALIAGLPAYSAGEGPASGVIPENCTAYLTVQQANCIVSHYLTCDEDAEGLRWRLLMDRDGPFMQTKTDTEYRWLQTTWIETGFEARLLEPETDPASLSELLETGRDQYSFEREYYDGGVPVGHFKFQGYDALSGETAVIDGETLLVTQYEFSTFDADGVQFARNYGQQYVHPEHRLFFGGNEFEVDAEGHVTPGFYAPITFSEPGESGFLDDTPRYGCDALMSNLAQTSPEKES